MQSVKLFFVLIVLTIWSSGYAKERVALVIGNADYASLVLENSINDAEDIASTLESLDFNVTLVKNASHDGMKLAISEFISNINDDTVGLFYYSGHAVQYKGSNYLIPIGSVNKVNQAKDLPSYTISVNTVLDGLNQSKSNLNFVFLDACRDNPFKNIDKEISPGLAKNSAGIKTPNIGLKIGDMSITRGVSETHKQVEDTNGVLIAYSTTSGNVASDGRDGDRNSPYTKSLLKHISKTNSPALIMLSDVQQDVRQLTSGQQTPIFESTITGRFCFNEADSGCGKTVINIHSSYLKGIKNIHKLILADVSSYNGQVLDGKPHGSGIQIHGNGGRYEGRWKEGLKHGKGYWHGTDGHYIDGEWKDDAQHGFGIVRNGVGRYEGNFTNGKLDGFGIYLWLNGDRYEGEWRDGDLNGKGIFSWSNGTSYEGGWKDGRKHGYGKIRSSEVVYEGEFIDGYISGTTKTTILKDDAVIEYKIHLNSRLKNILDSGNIIPMEYIDGNITINSPLYSYRGGGIDGKKSGYGKYVESSGVNYVGNFLNNMSHGEGVATYADGSHYKGNWINNKRDGYGVQDDANGFRYLGSFKSNLFHGKGVLLSPKGSRYEGMFKNHKFHGKGVLQSYMGYKYDGSFENGKKHGNGTFVWSDGNIYKGEWKDGNQDGYGELVYKDDDLSKAGKYVGEFKSDVRHGFGVMTWENGDRYEGGWKNDKYHGNGLATTLDGYRYEGEWSNGKEVDK